MRPTPLRQSSVSPINALILDLFGTLVETVEPESFYRPIAQRLGIPTLQYAKLWQSIWQARHEGKFQSVYDAILEVCELADITPSHCELTAACEAYLYALKTQLASPRAEAIEVLAYARALDIRTGVITNCSPGTRLVWNHSPLSQHIDSVAFSCELNIRKPNSKIYLWVCKDLGVRPSECLYVGDGGSRELSGARAVGMRAVLLQIGDPLKGLEGRRDRLSWIGERISSLKDIKCILP